MLTTTDAARLAELEKENRLLRAELDLLPRERSLFRLLVAGVSSLEDLLRVVEADRGDAVCHHAVHAPIHHMRKRLARHGLRIVNHYGQGWEVRDAE